MGIKIGSLFQRVSLLKVLIAVTVLLILDVLLYKYILSLEMTMWKGIAIGVLEILIYMSALVLILSFPVYFLLALDDYQEKIKKVKFNKI